MRTEIGLGLGRYFYFNTVHTNMTQECLITTVTVVIIKKKSCVSDSTPKGIVCLIYANCQVVKRDQGLLEHCLYIDETQKNITDSDKTRKKRGEKRQEWRAVMSKEEYPKRETAKSLEISNKGIIYTLNSKETRRNQQLWLYKNVWKKELSLQNCLGNDSHTCMLRPEKVTLKKAEFNYTVNTKHITEMGITCSTNKFC